MDTQETWNKKRIFLAFFLLICLGVGVYYFKTEVMGEKINLFNKDFGKSVKGVETVKKNDLAPGIDIDLQKALKEKLEGLKKEVGNLSVADIASSSPQIQKVLSDIKSLEQYPNNQFKEICKTVCGL